MVIKKKQKKTSFSLCWKHAVMMLSYCQPAVPLFFFFFFFYKEDNNADSVLPAGERRKGRVKGGQREQGLKKKGGELWDNVAHQWAKRERDYCRDAQKVTDKTTSSIKLREAAVARVSLGVRL